MPNQVKKILKVENMGKIDTNALIKKTASFSNAKEFIKSENDNFMPRMSCPPKLVKKFREEAEAKKWKFTTLMTEILEERYGKIKEELSNEND